MTERVRLAVAGMDCRGCENAIRRAVMKLDGVQEVSASHLEASVVVVRDPDRVSLESIRKQIEALGYQVQDAPK